MGSESLILTVNGGSSSIKFAVFDAGDPPKRRLAGEMQRIGLSGTTLSIRKGGASESIEEPVEATDHRAAARLLVERVQAHLGGDRLVAIGHRVVHGGPHLLDAQPVTPDLLNELRWLQPLDLAHLPREIALIEAIGEAFPDRKQVACFDTAFHRDLPRHAAMLPIPRRYFEAGVRRFGFHGLSYTYLMQRLTEEAGPEAAQGKVVLAHLGSGASLAAVHRGRSVDTTMAFTPTAGLVMGTRPGDLDPGLLIYLMRTEKFSLTEMDEFISHQCGLRGISETSSDIRDLQSRRSTDIRAADALDVFTYQCRKQIAAMAAGMEGIDTLVFSGGIGEHASGVRQAICGGLSFLGLTLNDEANARNNGVISSKNSRVTIRVIRTDEEQVIATAVAGLLQH